MIARIAEGNLKTRFGEWKEYLYYDGQSESIAFVFGEIEHKEDVICRIHSKCIYGHYFNSIECTCQEELDASQKLIFERGEGIIILLDQEGKGNGHFALMNSISHKRQGVPQGEAYEKAGFKSDVRDFTASAKILDNLNVQSIQLITANQEKVNQVREYGIHVNGSIGLSTQEK